MDHVHSLAFLRSRDEKLRCTRSAGISPDRPRRSKRQSHPSRASSQANNWHIFAYRSDAYRHEYHHAHVLLFQVREDLPKTDPYCPPCLSHLMYYFVDLAFLFTSVLDLNTVMVGAETAINGVLGGFIAFLIINWSALQRFGPIRSTIACIIAFFTFFLLLLSLSSFLNTMAALCSLISGLLISLAILPPI